MNWSRVAGTGACLPRRVVPNSELEQRLDTTDAWIRERTGITQRHVAGEGESTADLAEQASRRALEAAGLAPAALDLIVLATTTPDQVFPSTACLLQARLGAHGCPAFDIQAVCTGFVYALAVADQFLRTGAAKRALVVGAETFTRIVDWNDRGTCVLFGDGAGAVVLERADAPGILGTRLHADGAYRSLLQVPTDSGLVEMEGNEVFKVAVNTLGRIASETLQQHGVDQSELDWLIPHQANYRIIAATARKLGLPMERVVVTVDRHGNTSAASVPLALDTAVRDGRIQRGQLLLLEAFGGGFTWGSALVRY